ncbi:hypothetical protein A3Q56_04130 [Intoshia linei]|uniref:Uncharacterized protein n=1 Tax=Intoshia linei TaxID=1819745 RepID=A0A177B1M9_9BILA|nr:hypothetical protein A3Q56_04130 [Intoshia linei]
MSNCDSLSQQYIREIDVPLSTIWCRSNYAKLLNSYKTLKVSENKPKIKFNKFPNLSSAR